jgi:serine/threonine protein kinase/tetratricopeptide (TPR) repeat protein
MTGTQALSDREIFQRAVALPPHERAAYLDHACRDNAELRQEVESLLQAHDPSSSFMELPALELPAETDGTTAGYRPLTEGPGTIIGPYKLLEQIGEGGMGVVFMAEQQQPVRRLVALKIIKPGMDTRQVIARFEAEQQALALMDHPNIARVFDAGTTGAVGQAVPDTNVNQRPSQAQPDLHSGRPYFVMELVRGVPLTDYCDANRLPVRDRLELFATVCQAVQHAHQKGIIHRDLKPTNVLVTLHDGRPVPKVIDFGIAKATGERLTEKTLVTGFAQMIGTPLYMSPEQAELSGLDVDTRSDIYSLGVLLYELLTGTTPFDKERLKTASLDEMRRIIREEEPPRPSTRLSSLALRERAGVRETAKLASTLSAQRGNIPPRLSLLLRGELDWIVMKCLEKDRNRRYETASSLAADMLHFLNDEPVTAVAPSQVYRARKFIRRNKWPVIAATAVMVGLVAGMIGTTIGLVSQSRQRTIAERERAEAQLNLAGALQSQRKYAEAESLYRQGLEIPLGDSPADRQRSARTRLRLAELVTDRSGAAASEQLHREALAAYRVAFPPGDPNIAHALNNLANLVRLQQRFEEAEPLFREIYEIHRRAIPADHRAIGESATGLANVLITLGRYAEAEPLAREAVAEHQRAAPQDEWALAFARLELGRVLISMGKFSAAEAQLIKAEHVLRSTEAFHYGAFGLAALYTKWNQAEPGKGYDAKAQEWIGKLIGTFVPLEAAIFDTKKTD